MLLHKREECDNFANRRNYASYGNMSKYQIPFTNACIRGFGERFRLPTRNAYLYLKHFKGIDFLVEFYETLHLQSIDDAVDDLVVVCKQNGGQLE